MTIRSIPPASSHLALIPVPAPPPMTGRPAATFLRSRSMIVARDSGISIDPRLGSTLGAGYESEYVQPRGCCGAIQAEEFVDQGPSEGRVIDMKRQATDRAARFGNDRQL